jgi:DNA polymerase III epsilon subunit-like protein
MMSPCVQEIHGISMDMLATERTFQEAAGEIRRLLADASHWMGYNVQFVIAMLQAELERAGEEPLKITHIGLFDPCNFFRNPPPNKLSILRMKGLSGVRSRMRTMLKLM